MILAALGSRLPPGRLLFSPATLLRWHQELVRRRWAAFGLRPRRGRPPISESSSLAVSIVGRGASGLPTSANNIATWTERTFEVTWKRGRASLPVCADAGGRAPDLRIAYLESWQSAHVRADRCRRKNIAVVITQLTLTVSPVTVSH
jgi:hypothetical protein